MDKITELVDALADFYVDLTENPDKYKDAEELMNATLLYYRCLREYCPTQY